MAGIIQENVKTFESPTPVEDIFSGTNTGQQSIYPVVDDGKLSGIITKRDLNTLLLDRDFRSCIEE